MKYRTTSFAAAALLFAACQAASGQNYTPHPPIARPTVMPKPVANRLIKRETKVKETPPAPAQN
ncbi:MAG TPA: hypothetical protein VKN63_01455 [Afifellaceae bacterium]|nr:hypothetical protein [Afifellaceae bacterium]